MAHAHPPVHEHEWRGSENLPPLTRTVQVLLTVRDGVTLIRHA